MDERRADTVHDAGDGRHYPGGPFDVKIVVPSGPHLRRHVSSSVGAHLLAGLPFCERVLSCANDVITDGNTLLSDEEIEMLVVLRMNREFMKFMRENYNHLTSDHFGRTVIPDDA